MTNVHDALYPPHVIAFLGLGRMGAPMAGRLVSAGFTVRVFDLRPEVLQAFTDSHPQAIAATSGADAVQGAHALITMLPDGTAVREAVLGPAGCASAMAAGTVVIDMSSSAPLQTQETGRALDAREIAMVDAPVSGGVKRAHEGSLAIMAGGPQEDVHRCLPVLQAMGSSVFMTGALGSGHAMKALNNFVSASGLTAVSEALLIGRKFGLEPSLMVDILNASSGRNNSTENKMKQFILSETFAGGFSLGLMAKDLGIASDLADHLDVAAPLSTLCGTLWSQAAEELGAVDHTRIFTYLESLSTKGPR